VVVIGLGHGLMADRFRDRGIEGESERGDALQAFFLQGLEKLGADQDQALDEGVARVGLLGGFERAVEAVEDVDELEEQPLAALLVAPLDVAGGALPVVFVLGLDLAIGGQDLRQAVLGQTSPAMELDRGAAASESSPARGSGDSSSAAFLVVAPPFSGFSGPWAGSSSDTAASRPYLSRPLAARL
jgi:hypothetical protein